MRLLLKNLPTRRWPNGSIVRLTCLETSVIMFSKVQSPHWKKQDLFLLFAKKAPSVNKISFANSEKRIMAIGMLSLRGQLKKSTPKSISSSTKLSNTGQRWKLAPQNLAHTIVIKLDLHSKQLSETLRPSTKRLGMLPPTLVPLRLKEGILLNHAHWLTGRELDKPHRSLLLSCKAITTISHGRLSTVSLTLKAALGTETETKVF